MTLLPPHPELPVRAVLDQLCGALDAMPNAVLVAPPGAGKTTLVPLALADRPWATGRIVVLEPRRLAARAAARRMAELTGTAVGGVVGYRMRGETRVSARTRIEVVTEGVLLRVLHADAALEGVAAIVFDEFHERSLDGDVALAFALDVQRALRPELRLVVMSATLAAEPVARLLGHAPVVVSDGRLHPVRTEFHGTPAGRRWDAAMADAVVAAMNDAAPDSAGDVLAFCPGAGEIAAVGRLLAGRVDERRVAVLPLHGQLPAADQDRALTPDPAGRRKVVLATSIAETSLTIDGVRVVVDGGLARVPRFDVARGLGRLDTVRVSRASADQRRGRAGRQSPGVCHRLWTEAEDARLLPSEQPEITVADLTALALDLSRWGDADGTGLAWLDAPPPPRLAAARTLLRQLGILDDAGRTTDHGHRVADLPVHPRLGHLLVRGLERGRLAEAAMVAALLSERDVLRGPAARSTDLTERLGAVAQRNARDVDRGTVARVRADAARLTRMAAGGGSGSAAADLPAAVDPGGLVALAYPDRIGQLRAGSQTRYLLANGIGAALAEHDPLAGQAWLAVADVDAGTGAGTGAATGAAARPADARIRLAAPLTAGQAIDAAGDAVRVERLVGWDPTVGDVVADEVRRLGALVLGRSAATDVPHEAWATALLEGVRREGLELLPGLGALTGWRQRVDLLARHVGPPWPGVDDATLLDTLERWLVPYLGGARRRRDLAAVDVAAALGALLPWPLPTELDRLAPERLTVASGSRIAVDYAVDPPVLAVKLQELFGSTATPRLADGRVPVTIHLLSPAGRPVQVTQDLASFWATGYPRVRAELRGRYPRHPWPDDPLTARATARTTPRR